MERMECDQNLRDSPCRSVDASERLFDFHCEPLESRWLLAGLVQGEVVGSTLRLTGDSASNDILLSSSDSGVEVRSGGNGTSIELRGDLARVRRIVVDMGQGADRIAVENFDLAGSLTIDGGGSLDVTVVGTRLRGVFTIRSGEQLDVSATDSQWVSAKWNSAGGDSTIVLGGGLETSGPLAIQWNGEGARMLTMNDVDLGRGIVYRSEAGDVTTRVTGTSWIHSRLVSRVTSGDDDFQMGDASIIDGSLLRTTTGGDSRMVLEGQAIVTRLVSAQTIGGTSDLQIIENAEIARFRGSGFSTQRNVTYATRESDNLLADIYLPATDGPHPAILMIHGGYWRFGDKSAMTARARTLADRGYAVANINYRFAPGDPFPAQIHDVKSAIIWMRQNASELQIDPDRIGTYGYSAGGHLALLLGMTDGSEGLEGPDATGGVSTRVQAVVAGAPAVDFRDLAPQDERLSYFLGGTRSELPDTYRDASPANWISGDDPPTMIFVGESDTVVSRRKIDMFVQDLDAAGVANRLYEVARKGHLAASGDTQALLESAKFFDEVLKA